MKIYIYGNQCLIDKVVWSQICFFEVKLDKVMSDKVIWAEVRKKEVIIDELM